MNASERQRRDAEEDDEARRWTRRPTTTSGPAKVSDVERQLGIRLLHDGRVLGQKVEVEVASSS
jgi:hypothetical protein